ncbi:surface-adhesin E family protein [Hydrogenophilus thiooxidans]|uniref:surface-adhesin E family protein n=1 Tax=Hydrogenophilus thiooxidans TaxID=2820326 RepID=UPI001C22EAE8|nr:surface-adhesin E family protein [Hydrogenophilus thiooxidans]
MGETTVGKGWVSLAVMVALLSWGRGTWAAWVTVAKDREREVQVDTETILPAEAGVKVAWGRVLLAPSEAERLGFAMIRALNRFDCQRRTFTTVKRVYLDAEGLPIRDEAVVQEQAVPVVKGSVDERLWRAVCEPMSPQALQQVAAQALASAKSAMEPGDPTTPQEALRKSPPNPHTTPTAAQTAPELKAVKGTEETDEKSRGAIPLGVDLADPSQLPPEIAQAPVPNLLPKKPQLAAAVPVPKENPPLPPPQKTAPVPERRAETKQQASGSTSLNAKKPEAAPQPKGASPALPQPPARATNPRTRTEQRTEPLRRSSELPLSRAKLPPPQGWRYEGAGGPAVWDRIDPAWRLCRTGLRQSPITLEGALPSSVSPPEWFVTPSWHTASRTPQGEIVLVPEAPQSLRWRGVVWQLQRASWHHPVLHPGRSGGPWLGSWVLQFAANGARLFVEIPVAQSTRTAPELEALAKWAQGGRNASRLRWDWRSLLPVFDTFYLYEGSEPWPPCREGVVWLVYQSGTEAEGAVIAPLLAGPRTSRPPQPAKERLLLEATR